MYTFCVYFVLSVLYPFWILGFGRVPRSFHQTTKNRQECNCYRPGEWVDTSEQ